MGSCQNSPAPPISWVSPLPRAPAPSRGPASLLPHAWTLPHSSLQFSRSVVSDPLWPHGLLHSRLSCPSPTPRACSNSCPSSWWCHPTISSSVIPFACPQSFATSGLFQWIISLWSFPMSQLPDNLDLNNKAAFTSEGRAPGFWEGHGDVLTSSLGSECCWFGFSLCRLAFGQENGAGLFFPRCQLLFLLLLNVLGV